MKRLKLFFVYLLVLALAAIAVLPQQKAFASSGAPDLLITEIVPKSAGTGQPYEYVELYNNTSTDIDLSNYQLQYFSSDMNNPVNKWTIAEKTIEARSSLVLWLIKLDYPGVQLTDFNANYGTNLTSDDIYRVSLTTSAQGLHDSALRKVAIAGSGGSVISAALINEGTADGITNKSVIYQPPVSNNLMTRLRNNETPTPGRLSADQMPGPMTPAGLQALAGDTSVQLTWASNVPEPASYKVYQTGAQPVTVTGDTQSYTAAGLTNGVSYRFRVTAVDADGLESPASSPVIATPQGAESHEPPAAPTGLQAEAGPNFVYLSWNAGAEADLTGYRIYKDGTLYSTVSSATTGLTVTSLSLGQAYNFAVTATNTAGLESAKSAEVTATPANTMMITEVVPDTDNYAGFDAYEYIELYNASSTPVNLQGYTAKSGSWSYTFNQPVLVAPWDTLLLWTKRAEVAPLILEGFNHYHLLGYQSLYLSGEKVVIIDNVGGLANTGSQTVTLQDAHANEVSKASYNGTTDVAAGRSVTFSYPASGGTVMNKQGIKQPATPGWVTEGQSPQKPVQNAQPPQAPQQVTAVPGEDSAIISWSPNAESDLLGYRVYKDGVLEATVPASQHSFTVYELIGNQNYMFEVTAINTSDKESAQSASVTVTPEHQRLNQLERAVNPKDPAYQALWNISEDGPVIPGLAEELVPQGIGYAPKQNWLIVDYYTTDGRPSVLAVIDAATGKLTKSVELYLEDGSPYVGHGGGVTISDNHVWISSEGYLYQMNLSDLVEANDRDEIRFTGRIRVAVESAFSTYSNGVIWVGEFYESTSYPTDVNHHRTDRDGNVSHAWLAGYKLDEETDTIKADKWDGDLEHQAVPDYLLAIPDKIQGVVVQKDTIILSSSYGRNRDSILYRFTNPIKEDPHGTGVVGQTQVPLWFLDGQSAKPSNATLTAVPMTENIASIGNQLYVMLESGANKYRYTTTYIMDRMLKIDMDLWDSYGTVSFEGIPKNLKIGNSAQAAIYQSLGKAIPADLTQLYTFTISDPNVADVSAGGQVIAKSKGKTVITATYNESVIMFELHVIGGNSK